MGVDDVKSFSLWEKMLCVKRELTEGGISKDKKQKFQNYDYRGVEDVLGVISALHVKYRVHVKVREIRDFEMRELVNDKGKKALHMTALYVWEFQNADRPEEVDFCVCVGEGMDTGDKSSGKMQSYAYKNMMFYRYEIPVEGQTIDDYDPRADNEGEDHELAPNRHGDMKAQIGRIKDSFGKLPIDKVPDNPDSAGRIKYLPLDLESLYIKLKDFQEVSSASDSLIPPDADHENFEKTRLEFKEFVKLHKDSISKENMKRYKEMMKCVNAIKDIISKTSKENSELSTASKVNDMISSQSDKLADNG